MTVPRTVWALGAVSLLMDLSSELVHSLLPVFMTVVLGASMLAVGIVEGIAEATASILKAFSGALSDRMKRRKPLVVLGYALAALSKSAAQWLDHSSPLQTRYGPSRRNRTAARVRNRRG